MIRRSAARVALGAFVAWLAAESAASAQVSAKQVLQAYSPRQKDVEIASPAAKDIDKCQINVEREGKQSGYVVVDPTGQILRRFLDTNGDNKVDQWRYYNHGIEVYRDIDGNFNETPDQYRWVNLGGSRWGVDTNEDGRIDQWKVLSAPEATREAVRAMVAGDDRALEALMFNEADGKAIGLAPALTRQLVENTADAGRKAKAILAKSKTMNARAAWIRFDAQMPGLIPADEQKAAGDLQVYENAMCIIETGNNQTSLVQFGEMVRVGEVWKLTQVPAPIEGGTISVAGGILMQPNFTPAGNAPGAPSPAAQKLLDELQALDRQAPSPADSPDKIARFNAERVKLLIGLAEASDNDGDRVQWMQQAVDSLAAWVQTGQSQEALRQLQTLEATYKKGDGKSPLLPYVVYRRMLAEYSLNMQQTTEDKRQEVQKAWLTGLEGFISDFKGTEDAAEAMLQLAITEEFNGKPKEAKVWYEQLAREKTRTMASQRAAGALRRLDLNGKPIDLISQTVDGRPVNVARDLKGRVVLVVYWATWCQPCAEDLPQLRALYDQYRSKGFEIVGVCLDVEPSQIKPFLTANKMSWTQIYEPGGLESPPAVQHGVITLPTMILVDRTGKVVSRNASVQDVKTALPDLLPK